MTFTTFAAFLLIPAILTGVVMICGTSATRRSNSSRTNQLGIRDADRCSKHFLREKSVKNKKELNKLDRIQTGKVNDNKSHKFKHSEDSSKQGSFNKLSTARDLSVSAKSQSSKLTASSISSKDSVFAVPFGLYVDHILHVSPTSLRFSKEKVHHVSLTNQSAETIAIKTKCSDNKIYRVLPVYFVLAPNTSTTVSVRRESKVFKVDKLAFFVIKVSKGTKNAACAFAKAKGTRLNELTFVVPLFVDDISVKK